MSVCGTETNYFYRFYRIYLDCWIVQIIWFIENYLTENVHGIKKPLVLDCQQGFEENKCLVFIPHQIHKKVLLLLGSMNHILGSS